MIMTTSEGLILNMAFPSFQKSQVSCTKDSFITLARDLLKRVNFFDVVESVKLSPLFKFE